MSDKTVAPFIYLCRVCGLEHKNPPWGVKGQTPSRAICPCCGTEFGYDDATPVGIKSARDRWFDSGCAWFLQELKPLQWYADEQVKNLNGSPWDHKNQKDMI